MREPSEQFDPSSSSLHQKSKLTFKQKFNIFLAIFQPTSQILPMGAFFNGGAQNGKKLRDFDR